ncbi:MAG TPA: translocation/assembly module TamB domain-containing protein, partial [Polyangiaceae bacterium]|nr:translocation/assembly module TamB domain-containing protein [Polyangiaceae bacterium]
MEFDAGLPYRLFTANPKVALQQLSDQPLHVVLAIPRRRMDTLPTALRVKGIAGEIEGQFELTQERRGVPTATLLVGVHHLQFQQRADAIPITAEARLHYLGDQGKVDFKMTCADQPTLTGSSEIQAPLKQALRGQLSTLDWQAFTRVDVSHFPLRAVPALAERRVQGSLSGNATLSVAHHAVPEFKGELKFDELKIADVTYKTGHVTVALNDRGFDTSAELRQVDGGYLTLSARTQRTVDALDQHTQRPSKIGAATVDLRAARFRASALQPLLQGTIAEFDGLLDAQVNVDSDLVRNVTTGRINFRQGSLQLERFGEEFHGVEANITLQPGGVILLEGARARGVSGLIEIAGKARMKGLSFAEAHATVRVPKRQPLPVVIEGESMAEAWANLDLDVTQGPNVTQAAVHVRKAGVRIPDKSSHALQELGSSPAIRIGVQRTPKEFVLLPGPPEKNNDANADSNVVNLTVDLHNVEVRRGTTLRTRVDGSLAVQAAQTNNVTGKIQLSKGTLDVEGKRFEIERGVITFVGDPTNPEVVVTAGWTAPEGT